MDITAVMTVHREGRLLVPSLRSFQAAIAAARAASLTVEAYIIADRSDAKTLALIASLNTGIEVVETDWGDLGQARNTAVKLALCRYVAFLDADDLWGTDWLVEAWTQRPADDNFVAHPQWWVAFSTDNVQLKLIEHVGTQDPRYDPNWLVQYNIWTALCFAPRQVLLDHPYRGGEPGIGYEDWRFNADTAAAGIPHVAIPDTIHWVRKRSGSLSKALCAAGAVPGKLDYFESRSGLPGPRQPMVQSPLDAQRFQARLAEVNACEPRLWPILGPLQSWVPPTASCAETLWRLQETPGRDAAVMIVLPDAGGPLFEAAVKLTKLWQFEDPKRDKFKVTFLVTTAAANKANIHRMTTELPGADLIFLDRFWTKHSNAEKLFILQRFLTQNIPENVLCLDDPWLAGVLQLNGKAIKCYSNVWYYAGVPFIHEGRPTSAALQHLPDIFDDLCRCICQTQQLKDSLVSTYGLPAARLEVIA